MNTFATEQSLRLQNARLEALHHVAMGLTSTLELPEVLHRVVEMAQSLSNSAHAHIFLYDQTRDEIQLAASHWAGDARHIALSPRREGITYRVAHSGKPEFIQDTLTEPAYSETAPEMRPGALACLPLVKADRILGTLNLGFWEPHSFDDATRRFLDLMARQAAIAIETARLYADAVAKARLEHELQVARGLQANLIPRETPQIPGWEFGALWEPAHIVSGDYYDFVRVEGGTSHGIIIADVSDKGMPAALFMMLSRSTVRASITASCCPSDFISRANRLLCADTVRGMFVTLCYAQIDEARNEITYVNAGHNPPLFYRRAQDTLTELARTGIAMGVDASRPYREETLTLESGDFILFYTDGVTDATNPAQEFFGLDALQQIVRSNARSSAPELIAALRAELGRFSRETAQFDDITAVIVKRM